jgi:environmental stress-induced protein Ves
MNPLGAWTVVHLEDTPPIPWRNGGGITHELAAPPDATNWTWRASVAEVSSDGPFSRFEGIQRWFCVISGAGVRLGLRGITQTLTTQSEPFAFDGAAAPECWLVNGPTQDFNLMTRSTAALMQRIDEPQERFVKAGRTVALYSGATAAHIEFNGDRCDLPAHTLAWRVLDRAGEVRMSGNMALWMEIAA